MTTVHTMPTLAEKPNVKPWDPDAFDKMFDEAFAPRRVSSPLPEERDETSFLSPLSEPQSEVPPYRPTNPTPHSQPKSKLDNGPQAWPMPQPRSQPKLSQPQPQSGMTYRLERVDPMNTYGDDEEPAHHNPYGPHGPYGIAVGKGPGPGPGGLVRGYSSEDESYVFSSPEPEGEKEKLKDPVFEKLWNDATVKATQKVHKSTTTTIPPSALAPASKKPREPQPKAVTSPRAKDPVAPKLKKKRSRYDSLNSHIWNCRLTDSNDRVTFRDSSDGKAVTATFHLPGIPKEDVHISFQPDRLIVTWQTVKITESQEGDRLVRERREKNYIRTLHLPEGTRVSVFFRSRI